MHFILTLFVLILSRSFCSYSISSLTSQCISAESSSSYKWCRYSTAYTYGYYCTYSDSSTVCEGDSPYQCSTETSKLPQNSKKLLCPVDTTSCNTQTLSLATNTSYTVASSNYFSTSTLCWYKFTPGVSSIKSIKVTMTSLSNAKAEVYLETSTNVFSYQGSVTFGNSTVDSYDSVWVLVTPSSSSAYVYITAYASEYTNASSISLSDGAVAAIVICTIFCCCCCIFIIGILIGCSLFKRNKNLQRNQFSGRYISNQPPAPVINNYQYQIQSPNYTQPTYVPNAAPSYPTPTVYTGHPVTMNANPQAAIAPAHPVPSHPIYISKEVGVPVNKV